MTIDDLKPFGHMAIDFRSEMELSLPPTAWRQDLKRFPDWLAEMTQKIADRVWPRWNAGWEGASRAGAIALTQADLLMMLSLDKVLDEPARQGDRKKTNGDWYELEDMIFLWDDQFKLALPGCAVDAKLLTESFRNGGAFKFSQSLVWMLKDRLQRPRAHQAAYWLGLRAPRTALAKSAWSPSAISGHAYVGIVGCLNVFLEFGNRLTPVELAKLREMAVDIGDRRVFASVHYPSDNVLSWWTALEAIPYLCADGTAPTLTQFVIEAVRTSRVYDAVVRSPAHRECRATLAPWGL
jgi:hypothetical protein